MTTAASTERVALCDAFEQVGPDAPTLCGDWTTRDLAAHLIMRERRPDGAIGVIVKPLSGYSDKVQAKIAAKPWESLVSQVRSGPPKWSPVRFDAVDRATNTAEFFVHHEDVRRATPGWTVRDLTDELATDLRSAVGLVSKLTARKLPVGLVLEFDGDHEPVVAHKGEPVVTVRGQMSEVVMFMYGRSAHAQVELDGPAEAVETVRQAEFGV
jgi:uncharacterized protein (TIGR03085 family)